MTHIISEQHCKKCLKKIDRVSGVNGECEPVPGDLNVCLYCGTISEFDKQLNLIPISLKKLDLLKSEDPEAYRVLLRTRTAILIRNCKQ